MKKPVIAILMATYNGEKYIKEQIQSILDQKNADVHFYISDDGSSDSTIDIINEYFKNHPHQFKKLFQVDFKDPARNFLSILPKLNQNYDYYAFSDQDDVWIEDKLQTATKKIDEGYALYCGRTENTNKYLQSHGYSPLFNFPPSFKNAIVQSIAGSNTMVFNHKVFSVLKSSFNFKVPMHDWWTYLLTTFMGYQVYYDPIPKLFYRQHSSNFNGSNVGFRNQLKRIYYGIKGQFQYWNNLNEKNLVEYIDFGTRENLKVFYQFQFLRKKSGFLNFNLNYVNRIGIYRQTLFGNWALKLSIFLKRA
jgi:glycosyltransferase involved in cell wall biosynthesis